MILRGIGGENRIVTRGMGWDLLYRIFREIVRAKSQIMALLALKSHSEQGARK